MLLDYISLAWTNLTHRKMRTYLTMIGIFIGIAAVVSLISLGQGLNVAISEQLSTVGADKLFISPKTPLQGAQAIKNSELTDNDLEVIQRVSGVKKVTAERYSTARISYKKEQILYYAVAMPQDQSRQLILETADIEIIEGRMIRTDEKSKAVIASDYLKKKVFERPLHSGDDIVINDVKFEIAGIAQTSDTSTGVDRMVFINYDAYADIFDNPKNIQIILVQAHEGADIERVSNDISRALRKSRGLKQGEEDFEVQTPVQLVSAFAAIFNIVQAVLIGIAAISLIVGAVGIMNTMYTSVVERTKEIGIMKAIGAKNKDVLLIFLVESGLLGMAGGILGVVIGILIAKLVQFAATISLGTTLIRAEVSPELIIGALAFSFVIGTVSGVLPAVQASKMRPVDALRFK